MIGKIWVTAIILSLFIGSCTLQTITPVSIKTAQVTEIPLQPTQAGDASEPTGIIATSTTKLPSATDETPSSIKTTPESHLEVYLRYMPQPGTPVFIQNFVEPTQGCNWTGIGGQVFSRSGTPINNLIVEVDGQIEGQPILLLGITGSVASLGPGGYLLKIADHILETHGALWLQVFDLTGNPQTDKVYFDTYADCNRNLAILNFTELSVNMKKLFFLPLIYR